MKRAADFYSPYLRDRPFQSSVKTNGLDYNSNVISTRLGSADQLSPQRLSEKYALH